MKPHPVRTNTYHALLEAGLVACEVVAYQLAIPLAQKIARRLAGTAGAKVVHHRF